MMRLRRSLFEAVINQGGGAAPAWTPASPTTGGQSPLYWFEARKLTGLADGAAIPQMTDFSANARHGTQETADYRMVYKENIVNGLAVARSDGINDGYALPVAAVNPRDFTVFVVYAADNNTGIRLPFCGQAGDGGTGRIYMGNNGTDIYSRVGQNVSADFETATLAFGNFIIHCVTGKDNEARSWINGGIADIDPSFTNAEAFDDLGIGCYIRTSPTPSRSLFFDGDLVGIIVYPALDVVDRDQVLSYWATDYGITAPVWDRIARAITADKAWEGGNCFEPTVIYDTNPQILTSLTNVYKMWYTGGWTGVATVSIGYAESADGVTWTKYGTAAVLSGYARSHVMKVGEAYWMYAVKVAASYDQADLYTSTDGVTWVLDTASVIAVGEGEAWDNAQVANIFVWAEAADDWHMMYEAKGSSGIWKIGHATSTDGKNWTKDLNNPVISASGMRGGPWVYDNTAVDTYYYLWCHGASSNLPTDLYRYRSTDLVTWVAYPAQPILERETADEGVGTDVGQIADASILIVGDELWLYHDAFEDGSTSLGNGGIKLTKAPATWLTEVL